MKFLRVTFVSFALSLGIWPAVVNGQPAVAQTVTIRYVDHFGKPWTGCHVQEFSFSQGGVHANYAARFEGLTGRNIPFSPEYQVRLRCSDPDLGGAFYVSVRRPQEFILISAWRHVGDYYSGLSPRLTVSVTGGSPGDLNGAWVKVTGVYLDNHEIDRLDPESREAAFYRIIPGTYLVLVLTREGLACVKQIELLEPDGRLGLALTPNTCEAKGLASVKVVQ